MKRIFSLTMITIVLITLIAGCGGGGAGGDGTGAIPVQPTPTAIPNPSPTVLLSNIHGLVMESDGKTVVTTGAIVEVDNSLFPSASAQGNYQATTVADSNGNYDLGEVPYGTYLIRFYRTVQAQLTDPNHPLGLIEGFVVDRQDIEKNLVADSIVPPDPNDPNDPNVPVPQPGLGLYTGSFDWANTSFAVYRMPTSDLYAYISNGSGNDQNYDPSLSLAGSKNSDANGSIYFDLSTGSYCLYVTINGISYWLDNFDITVGNETNLSLKGKAVTKLTVTNRFLFESTYKDSNDNFRFNGYLDGDRICQSFFDNNTNKKHYLNAIVLQGSHSFSQYAVNKNGKKYKVGDSHAWSLSGDLVEKKILIDVINPTGTPITVHPTDPNMLIGGNTINDSGYRIVGSDPDHSGQLIVSTYDPAAGTTPAEQICIRDDMGTTQETMVVYVETKYNDSDYSANKKMVVEVKGINGEWIYYDVFGQDYNLFDTPVTELLIPIQVTGPINLVGYKSNAYQDIINIGSRNFVISTVASYGSREVTTFPRGY